jgi:hypothetical protein
VIAAPYFYYCFYEAKLCLRKFILSLFFSQWTPLHASVYDGHLEVTRLLVESKADVAARGRCFSPPPSHHLSLTICLAALATLHSITPSTWTKPTLLHTCAASALLNDALPRAAAAQIKTLLVRWGERLLKENITESWSIIHNLLIFYLFCSRGRVIITMGHQWGGDDDGTPPPPCCC